MLLRFLIWLGLKCPCGGWRTILKKYDVHLADVTLSDSTIEPVNLHARPCKKCGRAPLHTKTVKLKSGPRLRGFSDPTKIITYKDIQQ